MGVSVYFAANFKMTVMAEEGESLLRYLFELASSSSIPPPSVLSLANRVLEEGGIARRVSSLKQCNSVLFSSLYQALTGERVPGAYVDVFSSVQYSRLLLPPQV